MKCISTIKKKKLQKNLRLGFTIILTIITLLFALDTYATFQKPTTAEQKVNIHS